MQPSHTQCMTPPLPQPLALSTLGLAASKHSALTLPSLPRQLISTSDGHPSYTQLISTSRLHTSCTSQLRPVHLSCNASGYIINTHSSLFVLSHDNLHTSSTKHWPNTQSTSIKCSWTDIHMTSVYHEKPLATLSEAGAHPDPAMHMALSLMVSIQFFGTYWASWCYASPDRLSFPLLL